MRILQVQLKDGMIPKVHYLYYGGGAVILKDGHLEFTAKERMLDEATLYWFSINSNVAFPQDPGDEPVKPTAPTAPEKPEIKDVPAEKEVPCSASLSTLQGRTKSS